MFTRKQLAAGAKKRTTAVFQPARIDALESRLFLSVNVLVHHGDAANDGANLAETVLTPANVNPTDFGRQFSTALDAPIYAQPLYVQNVNITRGSSLGVHSVVFVATMHDSLYAIDANTGAILWQDSFLNITDPRSLTATTGVTTVPTTDLGSDNLGLELGILATPAIDLARGQLFLNANTKEKRGSDFHFVQRLWSVNLSDGSAQAGIIGDTISNNAFYSFGGYQYVSGPIVNGSGNNSSPTTYPNTDGWISAPGGATTPVIAFNALIQMERTSVTLLNGNVYLGFASHGDNGPYYGWVLGYSEANLALTAAFVTTPTFEGIVGDRADYTAQGGIWASGSAIATDGTYLYVLTGNGAFNTAASNFNAQGFPIDHDYADSLLKLGVDSSSSPTNQNGNGWGLSVADYFTPSNALALNQLDLDLGSGGVLLLPNSLTDAAGDPMLVFGGKESRVYLLDDDNLGKFNTSYPATGNPDPRLYDHVLGEYPGNGINGAALGVYSTPSYFNGQIYVGQARAAALTFNVSTFASGSNPPGTAFTPTPLQQSPVFSYPDPTFTISADGSSDGIVWGMNQAASDLLAFDATNITTPIYDSNTVAADEYSDGVKFGVVTVANGGVYLGNTAGTLVGFALRSSYLQSDPTFLGAPSNVQAIAGDDVTHVSWMSNSTLANEFRIDRSSDGTTWTTLAYVGNSVTSYDDTDPPTGNITYRVVPISMTGLTNANGGSISGNVFNDANGNGKLDSGETGTTGITVYEDANNNGIMDAGELRTLTDSQGNYIFSSLAPGNYKIREILPSGAKQTTPANDFGWTLTLLANQALAGNNFGELTTVTPPPPTGGSIAGNVFNDANGNGTLDSGETGLIGITVYNDANNNDQLDSVELKTTTDAQGNYIFSGLAPGNYKIRQVLPSGAKQTTPANGFGWTLSLLANQALTGKNFGELTTVTPPPPTGGSIAGNVFNDANGNGAPDSGEAGLVGITVYNDANNNGKLDTGEARTLTDANGNYVFTGLAAGNYKIREVIPTGWRQTSPANGFGWTITLSANQSLTGKNFGEQVTTVSPPTGGSISGFIFNDANGDQKQDNGESGLSAWTLFIDANNDGILDNGELTTTTQPDGSYKFSGLAPGNYLIRALRPSGWSQTTPSNSFGQHITLAANQNMTGVSFGERQIS